MKRLRRFLGTPFGAAVLALVALAGWALWSAGIFDDDLQRAARGGSVHAADGVALEKDAAARIIGNRRLFVAFLEPGADRAAACDELDGPADGALALLLSRDTDGTGYESYGCSRLPGHDDDANFGRGFVAETRIATGIDEFADRPLDALKVIAVNYDQLVKAGIVPDGARTIDPSLPRYLVAIAAVAAVVAGTALGYAGARRAGRQAARHQENRDTAQDAHGSLGARAAVLAQHIIELDRRYTRSRRRPAFRRSYRAIAAEYAELVTDLTGPDAADAELSRRIDSLTDRCRDLAATH